MAKATCVWGNAKSEYFNNLSPEKVLDAVEACGYETTGRVLALGSMENRVYDVEVYIKDSTESRIVKFYRPGRWSKEQIQDEHDFLFDLTEHEIEAIAPLKFEEKSVFENPDGLYYTLFPKKGGRACDEWTDERLEKMGRLLARLHNVGQSRRAEHRLKLTVENFGENNLPIILDSKHMPLEYRSSYENLAKQIFQIAKPIMQDLKLQRVHGDCHHGNIVLNNEMPFLIDFDDMCTGPRVQDIWMIVPGRDEESIRQRNLLIHAYEMMTDFDRNELRAIEALRSLRIIHFSAWISLRFQDMAFKRAFSYFGTTQYWEKELFDLRQQIGFMQESTPYGY